MELTPNPRYSGVEVAKALGGSFKLVTLAPRTVREMTQLSRETQKNGDTNRFSSDADIVRLTNARIIIIIIKSYKWRRKAQT